MSLQTTLRRCGVGVAAALLPLIAPQSAFANVGGNAYVNWNIANAPDSGLTNITFPITVNSATNHNDGLYFAQQFWFTNLQQGGYIGLQPRPDKDGKERLHGTFSVGVPGSSSTDTTCHGGFDTGKDGVSCAADFDAVYGHPYNLTVKQDGDTWTGTATDTSTGVSTKIGTVKLPAGSGNLQSGINKDKPTWGPGKGFAEPYLGAPTCAELPLADVVFGAPTTTDAGGLTGNVTIPDPAETDCVGQSGYQSQAVGSGQHIVRGFVKNVG
ncbi:hypothetical protein AB0C96_34790 [Streptomyces sp. NPDC048506]|uniref:hypothetical protein n=1 Tax=Streptomyces sp. NPDC048506 TaxID=3155028 RepID=UPI003433F5F6